MKHYNPRSFLRMMPNEQLKAYFDATHPLPEVDFSEVKARDVETVFQKIQKLPKKIRQQIDTDFQDIHALSCEAATKLLLDRIGRADTALIAEFQKPKGHHSKALWVFLHQRDIFNEVLLLSCRFNLTGHWKIRRGIPAVDVSDFASRIAELEQALGKYCHDVMATGKGCTVDYLPHNNLHFFFAYPEDYSRTMLHYLDGKLKRDHYSPAQEVIFVYDVLAGSLEIHYAGEVKRIARFQEMFAKVVLQLDKLPEDLKPTFMLQELKDRNFKFSYPPESGIVNVTVKRVQMAYLSDGVCLGLMLDASAAPERAIYDQLDAHCPPQGKMDCLRYRM